MSNHAEQNSTPTRLCWSEMATITLSEYIRGEMVGTGPGWRFGLAAYYCGLDYHCDDFSLDKTILFHAPVIL